MTELRWILLVAGILVIAAVYLYTRIRPVDGHAAETDDLHKREPVLGGSFPGMDDAGVDPNDVGAAAVSEDQISDIPVDAESIDAEPEGVDQVITIGQPDRIVTLRVAFSSANSVPGENLTELFKAHGLRFGNLNIFHQLVPDGRRSIGPIFSVASIAEPGSFDLANIASQAIPGITLFMVLPNPIEGRLAFESMLDFARAAMERFDGEVLDESGNTLSIQRAGYIRDEIIDFERKRSIPHR